MASAASNEDRTARAALFESYPVTGSDDISAAFNNQLNENKDSWLSHKQLGHSLKWHLGECTIGGNKQDRMYLWWFDADGNPVGELPKRFPMLSVIAPAAPIDGWYVTMPDVLRYGNVASASQRVVFGQGENFPHWEEFCTDIDNVVNRDRCRFLADNYTRCGGLLSEAQKKLGDKKGIEVLYERLIDSIEDQTSHAQFRLNVMKPKHKICKNRPKFRAEAEMLRVCPKDQEILDDPDFDPSGQIRAHLENPPQADQYLNLDLLEIKLPGSSKAGNTVLPSELGKLNPGAIGAMTLTMQGGLHSRDGCCSIPHTFQLSLLTNGPDKAEGAPAVDMMSQLQATKRPRSDSLDRSQKRPREDSEQAV